MTNVLVDKIGVNLDRPEPFATFVPYSIYHGGVLISNICPIAFSVCDR